MNPLVTIVIPAYNAEMYIRETIDSVLSQTYNHIELIVIDDGSQDNTKAILQSYTGRMKWLSQENRGQSATINRGWEMANGDIVSYLSADDALMPNAVAESIKYLISSDYVMTYCDYTLIDDHSKKIKDVTAPEYSHRELVAKLICQPGPGVFIKKEVFNRVGGWNASLRQIPDMEYWLRISMLGAFKRVPQQLALYRVHPGSQTANSMPYERAEEPIDAIPTLLDGLEPEATINKWRTQSISSAYLLTARMHVMSSRYLVGMKRFFRGILVYPLHLFAFRTWHLILNGMIHSFSESYAKWRLIKKHEKDM